MSVAERDTEDVAALARRLAVLLAAGTAPASAWIHVAATAGSPARVQRVAASVAEGLTVPDAILASVRAVEREPPARQRGASRHTDAAWLAIAAAWQVASDAGAPLAGTLESVADALRDVEQTEREVATALAGPASTSKLVMVLPGIGLLFGAALGFDTLTVLATTPAGWACIVLGSALLLAGRAWTRRLLGAAGRRSTTPGLELDLLAIAVGGGASVERAREAVRGALERCQLPVGELALAEETLDLSQRAGVPAAGLLRAEASQQRSRARGDGARAAAKLGVTLMLPLGACILPAFVAVGVVPLMIAVISSSLGTLPT
ncbi:hypothetical protein FVA74_03455 [Salinibacterium sp. dk2585]|nr:hypothetical protein FVA74_03455 [Salinibacterium sp. dk2585]TXK55806.1 hypothetical protein FVP63_03600 [Salinibacterium sp. dk5596]